MSSPNTHKSNHESKPTLLELRQKVTHQQQIILNTIWNYFCEHDMWMPALVLHQRLETLNINEEVKNLGGSFVVRGDDPPKRRYRLTFLGMLLTNDGPDLEGVLVSYLQFLKKFVLLQPEVTQIDSNEVMTSLDLTAEESRKLGYILRLSKFANGGTFSTNSWRAGLPVDIEELFSVKDLQNHVEEYALQDFDLNAPLDEFHRISYFQNKQTFEVDRPEGQPSLTVTDPYRLMGTVVGGKYRLEHYAGSGGMGVVYRASGPSGDVAIKILKPDIVAKHPDYALLFERDFSAARSFEHPNIVKVIDSGNTGGLYFMVMEWLDGDTLEEILSKSQMPIDRVVSIFRRICDAVDAAHQHNVIHLDIKPANVFLLQDDHKDVIKVIDFGMARIVKSDSGTTVTRFFGTYQYCSPEHFGGKVNSRSDIYSLGATLYHMLAGTVPFGTSYVNAKMHPDVPLPQVPSIINIRPDLSVRVDTVLRKALSKHPADRQKTPTQLFDEFSAAIEKTPDGGSSILTESRSANAEPKGRPPHPPLLKTIYPWRVIVAVLAVLVVIGGLYVGIPSLRLGSNTIGTQANQSAPPLQPKLLLLMFCDISKSLKPSEQDRVSETASEILAELPEGSEYTVYPLYADVQKLPPIAKGSVKKFESPESRQVYNLETTRDIKQKMSVLSVTSAATGGTCILETLRPAAEYFRDHADASKYDRKLIIISDMLEECPVANQPSPFHLHKSDIYDMVKKAESFDSGILLTDVKVAVIVPTTNQSVSDKLRPRFQDLELFWQLVFSRSGVPRSSLYFATEPPPSLLFW